MTVNVVVAVVAPSLTVNSILTLPVAFVTGVTSKLIVAAVEPRCVILELAMRAWLLDAEVTIKSAIAVSVSLMLIVKAVELSSIQANSRLVCTNRWWSVRNSSKVPFGITRDTRKGRLINRVEGTGRDLNIKSC